MPFELDATRTAMVVLDLQTAIVERFVAAPEPLLAASQTALAAARAARITVIFVVCAFRDRFPEISERNRVFAGIRATGGWDPTIHPRVAPHSHEPVVVKRRTGAFFGTDLDILLRAAAIDTLVLFGVNTSGAVLSTVRHAADADCRLVVVGDACADADPEVHACLLTRVFPRQAVVVSADELALAIER